MTTVIFIELYTLRDAWRARGRDEREAYIEGVISTVGQVRDAGIEVLAYGSNDPTVEVRAAYDYFAVYSLPSSEARIQLQDAIRSSGWYDYFDQVNVSGEVQDFDVVLRSHVDVAEHRSSVR
jgi:hypothetical protein